MKWAKKGVIFEPNQNADWMVSHASIPVVDDVGNNVLRVYFSTRDRDGRSLPAYIDVEADNPQNILYVHDQPILPLGEPGTFDDSGIMPSWLVNTTAGKRLYYIGWNLQVTVSYRLSIGLAISEDSGRSFRKYSAGPIADRGMDEPYFNTAPCVLLAKGKWRMWYVSCTGWGFTNGRPEPSYHVKYVESSDGIHWNRPGTVCIDYDDFTTAIGRPCVFEGDGLYKMLYSYRSVRDYRTDPRQSYRLGYAESKDGHLWTRKDDAVGIQRSETGWDSEMMEYCYIHRHGERTYLFYNGNGFGKTGFGYAVLVDG